MADERINSIVSPDAAKQLEDIKVKLKETNTELSNLQKTANAIEFKIGDAGTLVDLNKLLKELGQNTQQVSKLTKEQIKLKQDEERLEQQSLKTKQQALKVSQEEERAKQQILKTDEAINKARTREEKQLLDLTNDYGMLSKAYNEAALRAKNLALQLGANHTSTIQAINDAKALGDRLKSLDATVGQFQRNVGNYNMVGMQFNQLLRELPNLAQSPQIFIQAISNNITGFAESVKQARIEGASWKQILSNVGTSAFGLVGIINIAVFAVTALTNAFFKNKDAAKENEDSITSLGNAIDELIRKDKEYNEGIRNLTNTGVKAAKREYDKLKASNKDANAIKNAGINVINKENEALQQQIDVYNSLLEARRLNPNTPQFESALPSINRAAYIAEINKAREEGIDLAWYFNDQISKLEEEQKDNLNKIEVIKLEFQREQEEKAQRELKQRLKEEERLRKEWRDAQMKGYEEQYNTQKTALENEIDGLKKVADDENETITSRLNALSYYYELKQKLINEAAEFEISKAQGNATQIQAIEVDRANKLKALSDEALNYDRKILEDQAKARQKQLDEYNKAIQKSVEINEKSAKEAREREKKALDDFKKAMRQQARDSFAELASAYANAQKARTESELDRLNAEKEAMERNLQFDIARIQASGKTEAEKQALIRDEQAKTEGQAADIRRREIEAKRRAAQADRDASIANAIADTALAVIRALGDKSVPYPVRVGYAIAAGAAGAVQIASIRSTPLPAYEDGTLNHSGGKFIAGDGGEKELIVTPYGRTYWSKDKPTVYNEPAGTKVLNQEMIHNLAYGLGQPIKQHAVNDKKLFDKIEKAISNTGRQTVAAIRQNRAQLSINVTAPSSRYQKLVKGK